LGLKYEQLTYRFAGRDFRLTDVGQDFFASTRPALVTKLTLLSG